MLWELQKKFIFKKDKKYLEKSAEKFKKLLIFCPISSVTITTKLLRKLGMNIARRVSGNTQHKLNKHFQVENTGKIITVLIS